MNRLKKAKEAMRAPPPERLAKIEYQSHFLQMAGITMACIILVMKGLWYIIFAFVFGLGISYSQGMSAYIKYKNIMSIIGKEDPILFEKDISPTRRRSKIINYALGKWPGRISSVVAAIAPMFLLEISPWRWYISIGYFITLVAVYIFTYFFIFYWISYPIYKRKIKR